MRKQSFEDYEEMALIIRTVRQLLHRICMVYNRASFSDKITRISNKLEHVRSQLEEEMFNDYPDKATTEVFYGGGQYTLDIREHRDYIYSAFGKKACIEADAFIILTKQGVVLTSNDTRITPQEDRHLQELNRQLIERKMKSEVI